MQAADRTPVIIGVGEAVDRPAEAGAALEPLALMQAALEAAARDGGANLLTIADSIDLVGLVSWSYADPVGQLCRMLAISPARKVNASMGGETPIRLLHEAAIRIAKGEITTAAIVGGEAMSARNRAERSGARLDWTVLAPAELAVRFPSSSFAISPVARLLGVVTPAQIYPFYEMATQAAWGQSPDEAQAFSAALWARYAAIAARNQAAWIRSAPGAEEIMAVGPDNRMICFPYPKLMVANPIVNQAAAVIVTSLAAAREAGVAESRLIHIWGGGAAHEPEDYLLRDQYGHSTAQTATLDRAVQVAGGDPRSFGAMELYSCFPVVPKMALRTLGLQADEISPTVAGGLTFFGGPLNNYMTHAVCAMVRALRDAPDERGLLYGQGGYVNKHHTLVISARPPPAPISHEISVQEAADAARGAVPVLVEDYEGPARIETYTVMYGRDGKSMEGVVITRTPEGARAMARVVATDDTSMALLQCMQRSAIGRDGDIRTDSSGKPAWRARPPA